MSIDPFVQLVREYVAVIERASDAGLESLLSSCARLLPQIYAAGLELPDVEPTHAESGPPVVSHMERLAAVLGFHDYYFEIQDPYVDAEPVAGSLADDLADIYLDLAGPLSEYDSGHVADALWSWKFNIAGHCGDHLVDALRAIHWLIHHHDDPDFRGLADIDR